MAVTNAPEYVEEKASVNRITSPEDVETLPSKHVQQVDAVFGEITEDGPNYRNVGWLGTSALMMKISIGLGVLSIPHGFHVLGIVPGTLVLIAMGIITTWCSYQVGVFKINHPEVYGVDDAGLILFGKVGRDICAVAFVLAYTFTSGGGMLGLSIGLNAISSHGTCTAVFVAVVAVVGIGIACVRTLDRIKAFAWVGVVSIVIAVFTVTIAVGVQNRPADAPKDGPWQSDYKVSNAPTFVDAASVLASFVFAYAATPAFYPLVAEMRDPRDYKKALILCQSLISIVYVVVGIVVYYYCGSYVASPALGSAGGMVKKVAYGLSLPGLLASTVLSLHISAKYVFVRLLRGTPHLTSNSFRHWATWLSCCVGLGLIAYIIASAVPGFNNLASLVGALFLTFLSFQVTGATWFHDNWKGRHARTTSWTAMAVWCAFVVLIGWFLTVAGTYSAIVQIVENYRNSPQTGAFSCADNSNSSG